MKKLFLLPVIILIFVLSACSDGNEYNQHSINLDGIEYSIWTNHNGEKGCHKLDIPNNQQGYAITCENMKKEVNEKISIFFSEKS
ncbi:MAG: hypothetical protein NTZ13_01310 [Candidatus Parcubacteria bacterium]|nr:hypothetical protein [Candidatus Parcubacteria bacterium]